MIRRLSKGWLWRPLMLSLLFHGILFWYSDKALFEESTYAVATQVAGVSLELIPGAPMAQASMLAAPAQQPPVAPPPPQVVPEPPKPEPPKKEQEFVKPKEFKKKPLPAKPQPQVAPPVTEVPPVSSPSTSTAPANGALVPPSNAVASLNGSGQGGGSPDVRAEPDYLRNPPPSYPRESRRNGEEGTVLLSVKISPEGEVRDLELKKSSSYARLDAAALEAVRSWKFKPARIAGLAIESLVEVPVRFRLK